MQLFRAVSPAIANSNTELPIARIISEIDFRIQKYTTYNQLVRTYDSNLQNCLRHKDQFNQRIVLAQVQMSPQDMHWIIWKNFAEILQFLQEIMPEIQLIFNVVQLRMDKNGIDVSQQIVREHLILSQQFSKGIGNFTENIVQRFFNFMNKLGQQMYLRKTVTFLLFIGHCISIDKWPVMIHHQIYIYKSQVGLGNKIIGFFKPVQQQRQIDFFVTVASDGIFISDDHLLLSKVNKMIPFTNQMKIKCYLTSQQYLIYEVTSGKINALKLNFFKDYVAATNFGCGLGRALKYSGYNFLMGVNINSEENAQDMPTLRSTPNLTANKFESFAQVRENSNCKMYSDGCGYYQDLYNQLLNAQKQVCITGWMITPYFLLKRPGDINDDQYRLDGVLLRLAQRGVKIFIISFMQPALLVNNDSQHVQKHMQSLHKNIKVYRHPNVAVPQLWSHHQKLIVIDQKIGFMGGLDICYGRWDTCQHNLVEDQQHGLWDGCQFNNYRLKDIYQPRVFWKSNLNKDFQPRMPWHDIAVQIRGDVVIDLLRHFVQYWYFVKSQLSIDPRKMYNLLMKRISQANQYYQKIQKQYILGQIKNDTQQTFQAKFNSWKEKIGVVVRGDEQRISQLLIQQRAGQNAGNLSIQLLRSASEWSIGLDVGKFECSIHNCYISLINNAKSHIYIENQFFMGQKNRIVECLANRIIAARQNRQKFRVVMVMPLLPGFQGYIGDPTSTVLRIQMHWQYQAISRGKESLYTRLIASGFDLQQINQYIYFFGLRKGQLLHSIPVTQIIYVHSKLMLVDDRFTICGSANINDRSLLGDRDSQIAICIEDPEMVQTHNFRRKLFEEHFGLAKSDSVDILDDSVWENIKLNAKKNTQIFRAVFGCIPDDNVPTILDIQPFQEKNADISRWGQLSNHIKGHAVDFPLQFMSKQDLTFRPHQKEYFAPDHTFT